MSAALACVAGVSARLAGVDTRWAATALLGSALFSGACVCYWQLTPRLRRPIAGTLATVMFVLTAGPALVTLWPGTPFIAGKLFKPGEEIRGWDCAGRAVWILVASSVAHDHAAWWGEYELRVGDITVAGDLGGESERHSREDRLGTRRPELELPARYHRARLAEPLSAVRLERLAGDVPGGLEVSVFREPIVEWFVFVAWFTVAFAATIADVGAGHRGALGIAAAIPLAVSSLAWCYVTPGAALDAAFRAVGGGTFVGALAGYGVARAAAFGKVRLLRARRT